MTTRLNILMIVLDQLRYDCVGAAGMRRARTPAIDRFAKSATWFTHAFTPIPLCVPARQAMLTGRRPEVTGGLWNYDLASRVPALAPDEPTWTAALALAGWRSHYIGKWHVSPDHDPTASSSETGDDRPWMVRLDLSEPHLPCRPAGRFRGLFGPDDVEPWGSEGDPLDAKPYIQRQQRITWRVEDFGWKDWAPVVARYQSVIAQVDDAVGGLLAALERTGQVEDTLVILTADHGDMCGAHGMMDKHYVMYDDVVRVPLAIRLPGQRGGRRTEAFALNALDIGPTVLALADLPVPLELAGHSLVPVLRGETTETGREDVVATYNGQQFGLFTQRMLRERRWKYVWNATDVDELYDLETDPNEMGNRIADPTLAPRVARMRRRLLEVLEAEGDSMVANPWMRDQLTNGRKLASARS